MSAGEASPFAFRYVATPWAAVTAAAGSIRVAVPICTAHAPASSISTTSSPVRTPPTPRIGTSGRARATSCTARSEIGRIAGPDSHPVTAPSRGRRPAGSTPSAGTESVSVSPCAPARTHPRAVSTSSGRSGGSFAKTGTFAIRATAPTISAARSGREASTGVPSSSSGPEMWVSMAVRPGAPWSRLVRRTNSSMLPPAIETNTGAPPRTSRGSSSARNASMPGFCSPVDHTMPEGVSAIRGVEVPLRGRSVMLRLTSAADLVQVGEASRARDRCRRSPTRPSPAWAGPARSGRRRGCRLHPGHERTTGSPSGGVGIMRGASDSHRSHRMRAGFMTGPSMQARRWS